MLRGVPFGLVAVFMLQECNCARILETAVSNARQRVTTRTASPLRVGLSGPVFQPPAGFADVLRLLADNLCHGLRLAPDSDRG